MLLATFMALRYLSARKLRTTLTTLAVVFGVAVIFGGNLALPSFMDAFRRSLQSATETVDLSVTDRTGAGFAPQQQLVELARIRGVRAVTGVLQRSISLPSSIASGSGQIELIGVDPATITAVRQFNLSAGRMLQPDDRGKVVLTASMVANRPGRGVGSSFLLPTAGGRRPFTIVGLLADRGAQTPPQVILTLADAQTVLDQPGLINTVEIVLQPGADRTAVGAAALRTLGDQFQIGAGANEADAVAAIGVGMAIFNLLGLLALFVGAFLIFNTFRTVVVERRHDLAMLRAIGASRRQVMRTILIESLIQGSVGTALGLLVGYGFALGLASLMNRLAPEFITKIHVQVTVRAVPLVQAISFGLVATLLAGYFPARAAGKVSPLAALRPVAAADTRRASHWSLFAGALLCVAALVPLLAGPRTAGIGTLLFLLGMVLVTPGLVVPAAARLRPIVRLWFAGAGDLAAGNLVRQPGRAAITASTLMIGLAMVVVAAALATSFDSYLSAMVNRNFASDLLLAPQSVGLYSSNLGADQRLAKRLQALPAVAAVGTVRHANGQVNGKPVPVLGIDPRIYPRVAALSFAQGTPETAYAALTAGRTAIANPILATTFKLTPGDTITLQTANGPQAYQIVAIADEMLSARITTLFVSQANLLADFRTTDDVLLMLKLKPGADLNAAREAVAEIAADYPQFSLKVTADYRQTMLDQSRFALRFLYLMSAIILIPAALGMINTLTINVLERTREIGIVRAVGGSRRQVRRMVLAEALLLGSFGAALGTITGIVMSYGFMMAFTGAVGFTLSYTFPLVGVLSAIVIAVLFALVASILPARNAAKLDIMRAIQYE